MFQAYVLTCMSACMQASHVSSIAGAMAVDHISMRVRDYAQSKAFFDRTLQPLGLKVVMEVGAARTHVRQCDQPNSPSHLSCVKAA